MSTERKKKMTKEEQINYKLQLRDRIFNFIGQSRVELSNRVRIKGDVRQTKSELRKVNEQRKELNELLEKYEDLGHVKIPGIELITEEEIEAAPDDEVVDDSEGVANIQYSRAKHIANWE